MRAKICGLAIAVLTLGARPAAPHNVDDSDVSSFADQRGLFRAAWADGVFAGSDYYYVAGVGFDLFHPALKKSPLMFALLALPGGAKSYGLSLRQSLFTPSRIGFTAPIPGDRPWAAYGFLGHVLVSRDPDAGLTLMTQLDTGVIGPAAGGREQIWIHRTLALNDVPRGWDMQIRGDVVLDYYARLEKTIQSSEWEDCGAYGDATAGTLYDNAAVGVQARFGRLDPGRKNRFFLFGRGEGKLVGYDATLEGGVFNRASPYTLPASEIARVVGRWDIGAAVDFGGWVLEAARTGITREFATQPVPHEWVELSVMKRF
ncbi:MAG: lipid A deacylase LpxR family protein [Elusimicrobiota bacterium]